MQSGPMDIAINATLRSRTIRTLNIGFRVAAALVVVGLAFAAFKQEALSDNLGSPAELARGLLDGEPSGMVGLGILAIILTPFVSTAVIATTFFQLGDRRYGAISVGVLAILCVAVIVSLLV